MCITEGTFPKLIVVFNVPDESGLGIAGDLDPRGLDFGETCSGLRIGSFMMFIFRHNLDFLDYSPVIYNGYMTGSGSTRPEVGSTRPWFCGTYLFRQPVRNRDS